ncbi:hypothetical protein CDAR_595051 [Caerostris darwini]|uniref:Uncharacterized protein n=1 Tax=Caerostris darwini TaxID=1538125 RepID=A0AAV4P8Z7_9ARAC|nr:hypothetical protein CDAR_595051 [Caerostris darwini]
MVPFGESGRSRKKVKNEPEHKESPLDDDFFAPSPKNKFALPDDMRDYFRSATNRRAGLSLYKFEEMNWSWSSLNISANRIQSSVLRRAKAGVRTSPVLEELEREQGALDLSAILTSQRFYCRYSIQLQSEDTSTQKRWFEHSHCRRTSARMRRLRPLGHPDFTTSLLQGLFIVFSSSRKLPQRSYR